LGKEAPTTHAGGRLSGGDRASTKHRFVSNHRLQAMAAGEQLPGRLHGIYREVLGSRVQFA